MTPEVSQGLRVGRFDSLARVASGPVPTPSAALYAVTVDREHLRLTLADTRATVLEVPLAWTSVRRLGLAGAVVVRVDETPLVLDFTEDDDSAPGRVRRVASQAARRLRARGVRRRFMTAVEEPSS